MTVTELDLLKQAIDTLTQEYRDMREEREQWRCAYLNEVNRCDKLTQQVILLSTPVQTPVSTVEAVQTDESYDDGMPMNVRQAINARSRLVSDPRELAEWAESMLATGSSSDAVAQRIIAGAFDNDDSPETGFEGPDEV
jgi:hypothetical protein